MSDDAATRAAVRAIEQRDEAIRELGSLREAMLGLLDNLAWLTEDQAGIALDTIWPLVVRQDAAQKDMRDVMTNGRREPAPPGSLARYVLRDNQIWDNDAAGWVTGHDALTDACRALNNYEEAMRLLYDRNHRKPDRRPVGESSGIGGEAQEAATGEALKEAIAAELD